MIGILSFIRSLAEHVFVPDIIGVEMVGDGLTGRLRHILDGAPAFRASRARVAITISICVISSALFAAATLAPQDANNSTTNAPRFDVVSVKPCAPDAPHTGRGSSGGIPITSPGQLYLECYPLSTMLQHAYLSFADGHAHALSTVTDVGVEGESDWMKSERYTIEAKADQNEPPAVMRGPMLQAVLEDRFKLKVRRVTREMPVYELVVAKSGAKVSPYTGHDCVIRDNAVWPPVALPEGQRYCGDQSKLNGDRFIRQGVMTLDELASLFAFDRPVVNRTGITAPVSYRLEYRKEDITGVQSPPAAVVAEIRNQLGLDLRASKGPRDFLVIDHAERPTPNFASATAPSGKPNPPAPIPGVR